MTFCDLSDVPDLQQAPDIELPEGVPRLNSFYIYLTAGCNLRCRHCWVDPVYSGAEPEPGTYVDCDALARAVKEAKELGLCAAKLTGGEPMIHPQFREVVTILSSNGLSLTMETNGTLITPDDAAFLNEHIGFVSVSLDSPDRSTHDAFRGVKGAYDAAIRGLDALVDAGYTNVQVIMAVHRGNLHQIADLVTLAAAHGAASVKLNPVTETGRGIGMHERGEALDFAGYLGLADYVNTKLRKTAPIPVILSMPPALTPLSELQRTGGGCNDCGVAGILGILGTGEIALCGIAQTVPELTYGKLGTDSIRDIWLHHPTILKLREDLSDVRGYPGICGRCLHAKRCRTGCVANNYVLNGSLVSPQRLCTEAENQGEFPATRLRDPENR